MLKISVIIPVYNSEKYLKECIESVLSQKDVEYEVILVNDGSEDGSWNIIKSFEENDNIITINQNNSGANSARKAGLKRASGEYIFFLDSDDYIEPFTLKEMYDLAKKYNADIVTAGCMKVYHGDCVKVGMPKGGLYKGYEIASNVFDINKFLTVNIRTGLVPHLYRAKLINKIFEGLDLNIKTGEDTISLLAWYDAENVFVYEKYVYNYRMHGNSAMHSHITSNYSSTQRLYKYLLCEYKKRNAKEIYYKQLEQLIVSNLLMGGYKEAFGWKEGLYPFDDVTNNSKVILYGRGIFGEELMHFIEKTGKVNVIAWADKRIGDNTKLIKEIVTSEIASYDYDYLIVTVIFYEHIEGIRKDLINNNLMDDRVRFINPMKIKYSNIDPAFFN